MKEILTLLWNIASLLDKTILCQISQVIFVMLVINGQITMLGLSYWTKKCGWHRIIHQETVGWAEPIEIASAGEFTLDYQPSAQPICAC